MKIKAATLFINARPGVYIWWRGDVPLYVGKAALSMLARVSRHETLGIAEPFGVDDEIEFRECSGDWEARRLEYRLIKQWRPKWNKSGNPDWKRDENDRRAKILAEELAKERKEIERKARKKAAVARWRAKKEAEEIANEPLRRQQAREAMLRFDAHLGEVMVQISAASANS